MKSKYYLLIIILFVFAIFTIFDEYITLVPIYEQKGLFKDHISITRGFLDEKACLDLSSKIETHQDMLTNPLNESFDNSTGILFCFDRNNVQDILESKNCEFLFDIYESIRKPYANKFIMNVLIIDDETLDNSSTLITKNGDMAVDYHYDSTLEDKPESYLWYLDRSYLPECVSVLYVDIPDEFENGELEICSYFYNLHIAKIQPESGMLLEFNGKYKHGVHHMRNVTSDYKKRISIVLEQYKV